MGLQITFDHQGGRDGSQNLVERQQLGGSCIDTKSKKKDERVGHFFVSNLVCSFFPTGMAAP